MINFQLVTYYSSSPRRETKKQNIILLKYNLGSSIAARGSNTFTQSITIPSVPPSNLANCGIIDIDYDIKVNTLKHSTLTQCAQMGGKFPFSWENLY